MLRFRSAKLPCFAAAGSFAGQAAGHASLNPGSALTGSFSPAANVACHVSPNSGGYFFTPAHFTQQAWPATRSPQGEAWRRRELNPRPRQTNQPRLHAYSGKFFLLCDGVRTRIARPSPHGIFSASNARSPPPAMPAMAFVRRSRCPPANVAALGRES